MAHPVVSRGERDEENGQLASVIAQDLRTGSPPLEPLTPTTPEIGKISTHIDGCDERGRLSGWAYVLGVEHIKVEVEILERGIKVAETVADKLRPETKTLGHLDGASGFTLQLPDEMLDGTFHTLIFNFKAGDTIKPARVECAMTLPLKKIMIEVPVVAELRRTVADKVATAPLEASDPPPAVYVPGQIINCGGKSLAPYHTRGWHQPEDQFVWIDGLEGVLEMSIRRPTTKYQLVLDVLPASFRGAPTQTLELFVNYMRMGFFEIETRVKINVDLPSEIFSFRKTTINIHCRNAVIGTIYGVNEKRRLGIAVRNWVIA